MKDAHESDKQVKENLNTAFQDLDGLMKKASEMVSLAESIATKLAESGDSNQLQIYNMYLGISNPVTK